MWNFKRHLMREAIPFPLTGFRRYQHNFTHEVSHTALHGKVKSLWDEEWKGTHNLNVTSISCGITVNDNVTNFTNQGPLLTSFWVSMINSVTCAFRRDRKTFEKIKDFFRVNVGLMVLWLLFQQTTSKMYLYLPHHFGKSVTYDNLLQTLSILMTSKAKFLHSP
jgi:hypothetical protein